MRIAIVGCEGLLGSALCRELGTRAVPLDRAAGDVTDLDHLRYQLQRIRPAIVVNCAAYTDVDAAESHPQECREVNVQGVANLVDACGPLGCALVQISSDYVFHGAADRTAPFHEDDPTNPHGVYATSKRDGEEAAAHYRQHLIVRTSGLYGMRRKPGRRHFIDAILHQATAGKPLTVVNDQHCTPSHAVDVARGVIALVEQGRRGVYHVANSGAPSWHDVAVEIVRQAGLTNPVQPIAAAALRRPAARPPFSALDTSKYHRTSGPRLPAWQEALAHYLSLCRRSTAVAA